MMKLVETPTAKKDKAHVHVAVSKKLDRKIEALALKQDTTKSALYNTALARMLAKTK